MQLHLKEDTVIYRPGIVICLLVLILYIPSCHTESPGDKILEELIGTYQQSDIIDLPAKTGWTNAYIEVILDSGTKQYGGRGGLGSFTVWDLQRYLVLKNKNKEERISIETKFENRAEYIETIEVIGKWTLSISDDSGFLAFAPDDSTKWNYISLTEEPILCSYTFLDQDDNGSILFDQALGSREMAVTHINRNKLQEFHANDPEFSTMRQVQKYIISRPDDMELARLYAKDCVNKESVIIRLGFTENDTLIASLQEAIAAKPEIAMIYRECLKDTSIAWSIPSDNAVVALEKFKDKQTLLYLLPLLEIDYQERENTKLKAEGNFHRHVISSLASISTIMKEVPDEVTEALIKAIDSDNTYDALFSIPALVAFNNDKCWEAIENAAHGETDEPIPLWPEDFSRFKEEVRKMPYDSLAVLIFAKSAVKSRAIN